MKYQFYPTIFLITVANRGINARNHNQLGHNKDDKHETEIAPRIVGGVEVDPPGKYPFMVETNGCGATLIAANILLSAAHCAASLSIVGEKIRIGVHDLNDNSGNYETFTVIEEVMHPNFNDPDYDYSVIRLSGDSKFTPIKLDDGSVNISAGQDLITMGWGFTKNSGSPSDVLREVEVDYVTNEQCKNAHGNAITGRMMCASRLNKDSCHGDSGGPLIDKETGLQVGIVSWGEKCADINLPGVYARVSKAYSWIQQYVDLWEGAELKCDTITSNKGCNNFEGCGWNSFQKKCIEAPSASTCANFNKKKRKCKRSGCKWRRNSRKCVGRWD